MSERTSTSIQSNAQSFLQPSSRLAIVGAGVGACTLAAQLCQRGWEAESISLWEAGRGPGGRTATRRSRADLSLQIDHGASLFNICGQPPPELLTPLLRQKWIEPWEEPMALLDASGELVAANATADAQDPLFRGALFHGKQRMEKLCEGLLELAGGNVCTNFNTLVRDLERIKDRWLLKNSEGTVLAEAERLVLTGTLLAHPRSRMTFGWPAPPLQVAAERLQNPALNHALASIAALRFEARSTLLMRLAPAEAKAWQALPFRLLAFEPAAQLRWGLWRISIQPLADGSCAVVAHSSATFASEHLGTYGSGSAIARQLGLIPSPDQEHQVIGALSDSLEAALGQWLPANPCEQAEKQLMRWGAAFPLHPGLPMDLCWNEDLQLGFCGDFVAGVGFGRVEGAMRSAEALAGRLSGQSS